MKSTDGNGQPKMKPWKAAWLDANRCYKNLRANLWRLTRILNDMFDDAEFRADNGLRDDLQAADWIDGRLPELPIGFMELRTILAHYPDKASWEGTKLSKLRDSIKPAKASKPAKPRASKPDAAQLKRERDFYAARAKHLEKQVTKSQESIVTAESSRAPVADVSRKHPAIAYASKLAEILDAGVDYNDTELMESLERLYSALETILQPVAA